jgi:hypothetical protein
MNQENYCSLNVAKRLIDTGIVLETDYYWATYSESTLQSIRDAGKVYPRPYLVTKESIHEKHRTGHGYYPAPCFTEVWRELPFQSYIKKLDDGSTLVWICDDDADGKYIESNMIANSNPADALAELLIWAKGQG